MKSFLRYLGEEKAPKVGREAFLYLEPREPVDQFAQCGTCALFGEENHRCELFGKQDIVKASYSCGLYAHGKPQRKVIPLKCVTPDEAGLVKEAVRCENCFSFDKSESTCKLYENLNKLPQFDLDTKVHPKACCNAWT